MRGLAWAVALVLALSPVRAQLQADARISVDGRALGPDGLGLAGTWVELRPVPCRIFILKLGKPVIQPAS